MKVLLLMLCCRTKYYPDRSLEWHWKTLIFTIQSGTVTLVLVFIDADIDEVPLDEIDYNAPTLVSRGRVAAVPDLTMVDPSKQCYSSCPS